MTKSSTGDPAINPNTPPKAAGGMTNHAELTMKGIDAVLTDQGAILLAEAQISVTRSEARYRHLINQIGALIVELTPTGEIIYTNQVITQLTGFSSEELLDCNWLAWLLPVQQSTPHELLRQQFLENGELHNFHTNILSWDRVKRIISWNSTHIYDHHGQVERILYFGVNVTRQVFAEQALTIAAMAFESQEGMVVTDTEGVILRVNNAFTTITGYSAEEVQGKNSRILQSGRHSTDFFTAMWADIINHGVWCGEIWSKRKDGECYPEYLTITAVKHKDKEDTNYVGTFIDISKSFLASENLKHLAFYDPLTELPNRSLFYERLKLAMASSHRSGKKAALLFIDLDKFKTLNDSLGHNMGDLLLQQVARRLERCVRDGDTVSRFGGDEFVIMLVDLNEHVLEAAAQTEMIGQKILNTLNLSYQLNSHEYHITPSIGITLFCNHKNPADELLKQADIAMYQVKTSGRNALCFFDPQMQTELRTPPAKVSIVDAGQFPAN
jgi:diguanylate cyclase (GGDEF)-like protein/PAS domain S-box-containing protein